MAAFTVEMEELLLEEIEAEDALIDAALSRGETIVGSCVVLPEYADKDGKIIVTRDGLRIYLHRHLYRRVWGVRLPSNYYLLRTCDTHGCQSPFHHEMSKSPHRRSAFCRNGHEYKPEDVFGDGSRTCSACLEARRAKRPNHGGKRHWERELARQFCPAGHPYIPENMYVYKTRTGSNRKCKTCTKARAVGQDPAEIIYVY